MKIVFVFVSVNKIDLIHFHLLLLLFLFLDLLLLAGLDYATPFNCYNKGLSILASSSPASALLST